MRINPYDAWLFLIGETLGWAMDLGSANRSPSCRHSAAAASWATMV
jgi:hypothetical protein